MPDMSAEAAAAAQQSSTPGPAVPSSSSEAAAQLPPEASHEERLAAYQASVFKAFGGRRGLAEVGLPSILFVVVYGLSRNLGAAIWSAVVVAAVLSAVRLVKRDTLQHALGGLVGVLVCAAVAHFSGQAKGFYLPGVLLNIGYAIVFSVSALVRWPVVGVVLGPITGEMMAWREQPARLRAFTLATWLLAAMFTLRVCVEVPLYLSNQIDALGVAKIIMSYPLYLAVVYACWQIIRRAPLPPVKAAHAAGQGAADAAAGDAEPGDARTGS